MIKRLAPHVALLALVLACGAAPGTTCVQTMGPGCPPSAARLCDAEKIEDLEARTKALAAELPSALCSTDGEVRSYAFGILRYSRELDLKLFRDALLCSDQRLTEARGREARARRLQERQELLRQRAEDPESVSDEELKKLEGDPVVEESHDGEQLLERWGYAHATREERVPVLAAAIADGSTVWRRFTKITREAALLEACTGGFAEVRPQVDAFVPSFGVTGQQRNGLDGCRTLLRMLDGAATPEAGVEQALRALAAMQPVDLDTAVHGNPAMNCAFRALRRLAATIPAKEALTTLRSGQKAIIFERLAREHPEDSEQGRLNRLLRFDANVLGGSPGEGCIEPEPGSPCGGWSGW
jgi:hypothetical protein